MEATLNGWTPEDKAREFAKTHALQHAVDYGWVIKYAQAHYERMVTSARILDEKASGVVNYLGAMTGIAAVVAASQVPREPSWLPLCILPAIVLAVAALACALKARMSTDMPLPPRIPSAVEFAESCGDTAEVDFALYFHQACEEVKMLALRKGKWLNAALWLFLAAVAAMALPAIALALCAHTC